MLAFRCFRSVFRATPRRVMGATLYSLFAAPRSALLNHSHYQFSKEFDMSKHKQESQQFYEQEVREIVEITKKEEWNTLVMESKIPIVLDCYADWCKPCKTLTPLLESKAKGAKGWRLVKMDIDKQPQLAQMLKIKAVPTVYLIAGGRPVDGFSGMPDQKVLTTFFGSLQKLLKLGHENDENIKLFEQGRQHMLKRNFSGAEKIFAGLLAGKLIGELQPIARLLLCQCYLEGNKLANYEEQIGIFKTNHKRQLEGKGEEYDMLRNFLTELEQGYTALKAVPQADGQLEQLKKAVQADPSSLQAKFKLSQRLVEKELLQEALDVLLEVLAALQQIIKANKDWQGKKANNLLLEVFKKLGPASQLTNKYRKLYQRLLN